MKLDDFIAIILEIQHSLCREVRRASKSPAHSPSESHIFVMHEDGTKYAEFRGVDQGTVGNPCCDSKKAFHGETSLYLTL